MRLELKTDFGFEDEFLVFKEPIYVNIDYVDRRKRVIYCSWDFGMTFQVHMDSLFLDVNKIKKIKRKVLRVAEFDLIHAFFYHNEDPNYEYYHWALYGNLRNRIK